MFSENNQSFRKLSITCLTVDYLTTVVSLRMKYSSKNRSQSRIWDKEDMNHIIEQLCEQNGTFLRASRSLKQFRVLESIGVKELRYIDPFSHTSLRVIGYEELFNQLYWAWEQTGFAGWKPLHHKIREQGL